MALRALADTLPTKAHELSRLVDRQDAAPASRFTPRFAPRNLDGANRPDARTQRPKAAALRAVVPKMNAPLVSI